MLLTSIAAAAEPKQTPFPIQFEANQGQFPGFVSYAAQTRAGLLLLEPGGHRYRIAGPEGSAAEVRYRLVEATPDAGFAGLERSPTVRRRYQGSDPGDWSPNIPLYGKIRSRDVYPGVDVVYLTVNGRLRHDYVVSPGADPNRIRFRIEGAESVALTEDGDLRVRTQAGSLAYQRPFVYQQDEFGRSQIAGGYRIHDGVVSFTLGEYDPSLPLVIDPTITELHTIQGAGNDRGLGVEEIRVEGERRVVITGPTNSPDFPGEALGLRNSSDGFLTLIDPDTGEITVSVIFGGIFDETPRDLVAVAGNILVLGDTNSPDFPFQPFGINGPADAFLLRFNNSGELQQGLNIGGNGVDLGIGLEFDAVGNVFWALLTTGSTDLETPLAAYQRTLRGQADCSLIAFYQLDLRVKNAAYFGGSGRENCRGLAVDAVGRPSFAGDTNSLDLHVTSNAYQGSYGGGSSDAFAVRFNANLTDVDFSTYLGGEAMELTFDHEVGPNGELVWGGVTDSVESFPVSDDAPVAAAPGPPSPFVTLLDPESGEGIVSYIEGGQGVLDLMATSNFLGDPIVLASMFLPGANGATSTTIALLDRALEKVSEELIDNVAVEEVRPRGLGSRLLTRPDLVAAMIGTLTAEGDADRNDVFVGTVGFEEDNTSIFDIFSPERPELQVIKLAPESSRSGEVLEFSIWVKNVGQGVAQNVILEEFLDLPADVVVVDLGVTGNLGSADNCEIADLGLSCSFGDMPARTAHSLVVRATAVTANGAPATIVNRASLTADNASTTSDTTETLVSPVVADLQTNKRLANPDQELGPEAEVEFVITVRNAGPDDASNVILEDLIDPRLEILQVDRQECDPAGIGSNDRPAVTCDFPTLPADEEIDVRVTARTDSAEASAAPTAATARSDEHDPNRSNNITMTTIDWDGSPLANLVVALTAFTPGDGSTEPGEVLLEAYVMNLGPDPAAATHLTLSH